MDTGEEKSVKKRKFTVGDALFPMLNPLFLSGMLLGFAFAAGVTWSGAILLIASAMNYYMALSNERED